MAFNLDPLDISLTIERRMYRLGDTINATVSLIPSGGVRIREASLNLVAEVKRTEVKAGWALDMAGSHRYNASRVPTRGTPVQTVSMEAGYSAPFLSSSSLKVGRPGKYKVALELGPRLPRVVQLSKELELDTNSSLSIEKWWLEVQVDVVMGPDQSVRKEIDVSLS